MTDPAGGRRPVLLDGGMSNALEDRGHDLADPLWTARLLRDAPDEIAAVHRTYFAAGAQVATTASYQASVDGWRAAGLSRVAGEKLIRSSVTIAREVRDELAEDGVRRWVAASVGPYGATLADGSEYRGRYGLSAGRLRDFHRPRIELLAEAGPDVLAIETIPDLAEAEVLVDLVNQLRLPAWISYTISGGRTRAGQPLREAFRLAASAPSVFAVGVNCCTPADVLPAVELLATVTDKPAICYPNSGQDWDPVRRAWSGPSAFDPRLAAAWVAAGARYLGGCCRVGPAQIAALRAVLSPVDGSR